MCCISALVLLPLVLGSHADVVLWVADAGLERANNYAELTAPCGRSRVILPSSAGMLRLPPLARELVLPRDAELYLSDLGLILGPDISDPSCVAQDLHYVAGEASWTDPASWTSYSHNAATPDAERVPCAADVAMFPVGTNGAVVLPDDAREVAHVALGNVSASEEELFRRARTGEGLPRFLFGPSGRSGLIVTHTRCRSVGGCPCQRGRPMAQCPASCPVPACSSPVTPKGNCCAVCGAVLQFTRSAGFVMISFRRLASIAAGAVSSVEYHASVLDPDMVQLVVVDRGMYSGQAALVVERVRSELKPSWAEAVQWSSSSAMDRGGGWASAGGALLAVLSAGVVVWVRYYPPRWMSGAARVGNLWTRGRSDSLLTLTRRDSEPTASFRNPLYDSQRGSVRITQNE